MLDRAPFPNAKNPERLSFTPSRRQERPKDNGQQYGVVKALIPQRNTDTIQMKARVGEVWDLYWVGKPKSKACCRVARLTRLEWEIRVRLYKHFFMRVCLESWLKLLCTVGISMPAPSLQRQPLP